MFDPVVYRLRDGRVVEPDRLYLVRGGFWAEPAPSSCPSCGQAFGPRAVLVGALACLHIGGHHRLHICAACGHVVYTPPVAIECEHSATRPVQG